MEVFDNYFNKEFEDDLIKKKFKLYINLFQSYIDYENEITLKIFQFWNLKLKIKIDDLIEINGFRISNLNKVISDLLSKKLIKFNQDDLDEIEEKENNEIEVQYNNNHKKKKNYIIIYL
jgi:hypothetical protein